MSRLILITGGSSGIGKQLAADFLTAGDRVIVVGEKSERLHHAVAELSGIASSVSGICCDVGAPGDVERMRAQVLGTHGCPDILINNAGFATYRTFEQSDPDEIEQLINVNLLGAMRCARAFLPDMIARRAGAIVNMASIAGRLTITPNATYGAAKHGLVAWSDALRHELARFNIQVNAVCPGRIETPFFDHETFKRRAPRPETRFTITVQDAARATRRAIARNRFVTYVPWTLGLLVWLTNVMPFLIRPVYGRLLRNRVESLYR